MRTRARIVWPLFGMALAGALATPTPAAACTLRLSGTLDGSMIRRVIRRALPKVSACYQLGLQQNPRLEGRVQLWFQVGGDGQLIALRVTGPQPGGDEAGVAPEWERLRTLEHAPDGTPRLGTQPGVLACISQAMAGLVFPAQHTGRGRVSTSLTEVQYPLMLRPSSEPRSPGIRPVAEISDEELAQVGAATDPEPWTGD